MRQGSDEWPQSRKNEIRDIVTGSAFVVAGTPLSRRELQPPRLTSHHHGPRSVGAPYTVTLGTRSVGAPHVTIQGPPGTYDVEAPSPSHWSRPVSMRHHSHPQQPLRLVLPSAALVRRLSSGASAACCRDRRDSRHPEVASDVRGQITVRRGSARLGFSVTPIGNRAEPSG